MTPWPIDTTIIYVYDLPKSSNRCVCVCVLEALAFQKASENTSCRVLVII